MGSQWERVSVQLWGLCAGPIRDLLLVSHALNGSPVLPKRASGRSGSVEELGRRRYIIAPRLRTDGLNKEALASSGGGQIGDTSIALFTYIDRRLSDDEEEEMVKRRQQDLTYEFKLVDYKEACAIFIRGNKIKRRHVVAYVANKKGGVHLDTSRKKDEEAYLCLDAALASGWFFGGKAGTNLQEKGSKNPVFMELLSIGQQIARSGDIQQLVATCKYVLSQAP